MRRSARAQGLVALLAAIALPAGARADIDGRLSITGVILSESQDPPPQPAMSTLPQPPSDASPVMLGYGDLRASLRGRRLSGGFEFGADFRLRITSDFSSEDTITGNLPTTARGYSGGREYDLREAFVGRRGDSIDFHAGRLIIRESDALRVDGIRLSWRFSPAWTASVFGGLLPNPYSRSLTQDYVTSPNGDGSGLSGAAGGSIAYNYPRIWGSASVGALILGGNDDGGTIDPLKPEGITQTEAARVYLTWTNYLRIASWLDLFHDVVADVAGPAGAQLTRADVLLHLHVPRFTLAVGYDHLSTIAMEMYLLRLLGDRRTYLPGTVENNLIVQRTGRDEGHLRAEVNPFGRVRIYGDARLRRRGLVESGADPAFAGVPSSTAWDITGGARSAGDLAGLRIGAWFTEIVDFRAETRLAGVDLGRDFLDERLAIDASFLWEGIRDTGAGTPLDTAACAKSPLDTLCFGHRDATVYQAGITIAARPTRSWLLLGDYRLVYTVPGDTTNAAMMTSPGRPITTHVAFARLEVRF